MLKYLYGCSQPPHEKSAAAAAAAAATTPTMTTTTSAAAFTTVTATSAATTNNYFNFIFDFRMGLLACVFAGRDLFIVLYFVSFLQQQQKHNTTTTNTSFLISFPGLSAYSLYLKNDFVTCRKQPIFLLNNIYNFLSLTLNSIHCVI